VVCLPVVVLSVDVTGVSHFEVTVCSPGKVDFLQPLSLHKQRLSGFVNKLLLV